MPTALFSRTDVERRIDFARALEVVERTYVETARDRVVNPSKLGMHMGDDGEWPDLNAFSVDMPAYVDWLGVAGMKWAVATWDADTEVPISALILLFDVERARFTAVMEGMYLTGVRTALQTVVGLKHLAPFEVESVGVFGAGYQARFQVSVIDALLDVARFGVFDVDRGAAGDLAATLGPETDAEIVACDRPEDAAAADAVVTVTDSRTPVLEEEWLAESAFVIALGSYRELPDGTVLGADHVVVDHVEQALQRGALADLAERGEFGRSDVDATIGDVLDSDYADSIGADDRVVFVPIGLGALDVAIAEGVRESETDAGGLETFDFG